MIRRRAARLLLVSIAAASLFGCEAANDQSATPVASTEPRVASSGSGTDAAVVASREVLSVTVSALAAPASTSSTTPAPSKMASAVPAPSTTVVVTTTVTAPSTTVPPTTVPPTTTTEAVPTEPPSFGPSEMQLAPTTTVPPTTTRPPAPRPSTTRPPTTSGAVREAPAPAPAPSFEPAAAPLPLNAAAAADFQRRTNSLRASLGLEPLSRNARLDAYAASWARELAAAGRLSHSSSPEAALDDGWTSAGENVGFGSTVASVHEALVASAGHYANLARPTYSAIGVAVAVDANGRLWLCEVFAG